MTDAELQSLIDSLQQRKDLLCPTCQGRLVVWKQVRGSGRTEEGMPILLFLTKAYCFQCQQHYMRTNSPEWKELSDLEGAPTTAEALQKLADRARHELEAEKIRKNLAEKKAKARVWARKVDPNLPRFSQFFQFVCPFCSHSEKVGLWFPSKTCPQCNTVISIYRRPK